MSEQWKLEWEQEGYPDPGREIGKTITLKKSFDSEQEMDRFIIDQKYSARFIGKPFRVIKKYKCEVKDEFSYCEDLGDTGKSEVEEGRT